MYQQLEWSVPFPQEDATCTYLAYTKPIVFSFVTDVTRYAETTYTNN